MQLKYLILSLLILSLIITSISIVQVKAQTTANITQLEQEIQQLNETLQSLLNRTSAYYPVSVPSWLDSGSNAWMLTAATLVGLQSVPGVALYYAGLVKKKYAVNTAAMILYAFAAVLIVWMLVGYNFGFGPSSIKIGTIYLFGTPKPAWSGLYEATQAIVGPFNTPYNIPMSTMIFFQFVFAAITPILLTGGVLERINFKAWMLFVPIWSLLVYSPLAFWLFAGGWLNQWGAVDFSGGYVIHVAAGFGALSAALTVGPRLKEDRKLEPHNLGLLIAGTGLIWLGWNGFNGGDSGGATIDAAIAVLNTEIAAAVSLVTWMVMDIIFLKKPTLVGATSGAITGLVAITPAAGYVNGWEAMLIGIASGSIPWLALYKLEARLKVDDTLGVFSTHGIAGLVGGILTGVFADPFVTKYVDPSLVGALYGNIAQVGIQALAGIIAATYVFTMTFIILKIIGIFVPLRAPPEQLREGDYAIHGERIMPEIVITEERILSRERREMEKDE